MNNYTTPQQMPDGLDILLHRYLFGCSLYPFLRPSVLAASTSSPWLGPTYYTVSTS